MKNKMINLRNRTIKGQSYLINKYGIDKGLVADAYLYIKTHQKLTKEMNKSLDIWINASSDLRDEVLKIIEIELSGKNE